MEKINVAEILKDCQNGMELDCTIFDDSVKVIFNRVDKISNLIKIVVITDNNRTSYSLTEYGQWDSLPYAKCVIFPKGKTTWEGFQRPFKDGDILSNKSICIFKKYDAENANVHSYCGLDIYGKFHLYEDGWTNFNKLRFATEEEKEKLFKAIKDHGYRWNPETKTLEEVVKPNFKVGDRIRHKASSKISKIIDIRDGSYITGNVNGNVTVSSIPFSVAESDYELITKFDISTLIPFESRVLVRDDSDECWIPAIWALKKVNKDDIYSFVVVGGNDFVCCIPYDGNQYLLGTTKECEEYYKTWE